LPLAVAFAEAGFVVVGVDLDTDVCDAVNSGRSLIADVPGAAVADLVSTGRLRAVTDIASAGAVDAVLICVPTPLRKPREPDLSQVVSAAQSAREQLRPGMLIALESTTYPGTTDDVLRTILEQDGLCAGVDFFLAFSPERVDPANPDWTTRNLPKVVGGLTPDCSTLAAALYGCAIDQIVPVSSPRTAEMVKLLENTFRAVNIGLVNELAQMCDRLGVDVWEVIDAAATKPFGFMPFYPGPGLGGHCIPVDPSYLSWKVREVGLEARFIDLAFQVNGAMPQHVVDKIGDALNNHAKAVRGAKVLLLGMAYKRDVGDVRESPALDVMALLHAKGAQVSYYDPYVPHIDAAMWAGGFDLACVDYSAELLRDADCVAVLTDHRAVDYEEVASAARLVVDTRNAIAVRAPHLFRLGAPDPENLTLT
jgi:UDP-N-acetyl-D-glucosamine dehydrogenase